MSEETPNIKEKKSGKVERFIVSNTPASIKKGLNWLLDKLPTKWGNWIRTNKFLSICIFYTFRGLFLRPSMWAVYAAALAYFQTK